MVTESASIPKKNRYSRNCISGVGFKQAAPEPARAGHSRPRGAPSRGRRRARRSRAGRGPAAPAQAAPRRHRPRRAGSDPGRAAGAGGEQRAAADRDPGEQTAAPAEAPQSPEAPQPQSAARGPGRRADHPRPGPGPPRTPKDSRGHQAQPRPRPFFRHPQAPVEKIDFRLQRKKSTMCYFNFSFHF